MDSDKTRLLRCFVLVSVPCEKCDRGFIKEEGCEECDATGMVQNQVGLVDLKRMMEEASE